MKTFKFIDLFCGIWWFHLALSQLGWECVFSSDIDEKCRNTYFNNFWLMPTWDISLVNENDIPDYDVLCAGFPCQPFSIAWKRLWFEDTRWTLFFEIARLIKNKRPKALILENVRWLVNHNNWETLNTIINVLKELNYNVHYKVLNAKNFWVPQNRERILIVWFYNQNPPFNFPEKADQNKNITDIIDLNNNSSDISLICKTNIYKHLEDKIIIRNKIMRGELVFAYEIRKSKCSYKHDWVSPCLTAKMWTWWNNIPVVIWLDRKITIKEWLKLMWFPETYKLSDTHDSYKQIGNAVVVPMIKEVAKNVIKFI